MLDPRRLRTDLDGVRRGITRRGGDPSEADRLAALDADVRSAIDERDRCRADVKRLSKDVGAARKAGETDKAEQLQAESRALGEQAAEHEKRAAALEAELREILLVTPNTPADDAPDGASEHDNVVRRTWAPAGIDPDAVEAAYADHQRIPHWETGTALGILDLERAAKLSGSMFPMLRGQGARLIRSLTQIALDRHVDGGWEEIRPPTMVRTETMVSTGHLPKFADEAYHLERDDLWAIPTAEVPLTSMARDELLDPATLPQRFVSATACYRREAGSAGRDTRGLLRSHEFDKVELMAVCTADQAPAIHAEIQERAEGLLQDLGLAYRVLDLCTGDLGFGSARTYDLEVYAPGVGTWLEVSSVSWYSDFQARRANIRHRNVEGGGSTVAHTCNGSALAWPRVVAALLEVGRQPDGTVALPAILHDRMGTDHLG